MTLALCAIWAILILFWAGFGLFADYSRGME